MKPELHITAANIQAAATFLARKLIANVSEPGVPLKVWGVPRGGVLAAYALLAYSPSPGMFQIVDTSGVADVIMDDLVDTGEERERWKHRLFAVLFDKQPRLALKTWFVGTSLSPETGWLVFPWEKSDERPTR